LPHEARGADTFYLSEQLWDLRSQEQRPPRKLRITWLPSRILAVMVEIYVRFN
jgi:hypothetical protein